jgi:hypothetical protein
MLTFIHVPRERRTRRESLDDERLQRTFRRNFIIMFLSLALAATAILSARLCAPANPQEQSPEAARLEKQLRILFPDMKVEVNEIENRGEVRTIEIEITTFDKVGEPAPLIARAESVVYDESVPGDTQVVIRIFEEEDGGEAIVALHSTTMRKIGDRLKLRRNDDSQN